MTTRVLAMTIAAMAFAQVDGTVVFDRAIDPVYRLRVLTTRGGGAPSESFTTVRVLLVERGGLRTWEFTSFRGREDQVYEVERATARVLVLYWWSDPYGFDDGNIKLFLDLTGKRVDKRIDFAAARDLEFAGDAQARDTLRISEAELHTLRERGVFATTAAKITLPELFTLYPLPTSTKASVLARPEYRGSGITADDIEIDEAVGPYQAEGDRVWFGKTFYDGEGLTGLGAIGFLDQSGKYEFLSIPEVLRWSAGAILVEPDTIWAGLVGIGEHRPRSGGLLEYDRRSRQRVVHKIPDVVHSLVNLNGVLFAGTDRGLYVIRAGAITRYRMEPDINGNFAVISQRL